MFAARYHEQVASREAAATAVAYSGIELRMVT
jgi:hypothetical protein